MDIDKSSVFTTYSISNRGPLIKIREDKCINSYLKQRSIISVI